jgi:hypothetical protein
MFTIRFKTVDYRPDVQITLRNSVDGWEHDIPGIYENDEWRFELAEQRYPGAIEFKLVLERTYWMLGANLVLPAFAGADHLLAFPQVAFPQFGETIVENSHFQQTFFGPVLDEGRVFDVIVIGSGVGGGILADQLTTLARTFSSSKPEACCFPPTSRTFRGSTSSDVSTSTSGVFTTRSRS